MELRRRPTTLKSVTVRVPTAAGTAFVTVGYNEDGPMEVFINLGKGGSESFAIAEALGRLISTILRLEEPGNPWKRLEVVIDQLSGIGGVRSGGAVPSVPDAVAYVLYDVLKGGIDESEPDSEGPEAGV